MTSDPRLRLQTQRPWYVSLTAVVGTPAGWCGEGPLALLFGAGASDDDHHGHSHGSGSAGIVAEMLVTQGQLLSSLAASILELSETYATVLR